MKKRYWVLGAGAALVVIIGVASASGGGNQSSVVVDAGSQPVPEAQTVGAAGDTLTAEGLSVTANELDVQSNAMGTVMCSRVHYTNSSGENVSFNGGFDWKLQDPAKVIHNPSLMGDNKLSAGELADGGEVAGNVCFDANGSGNYKLTMEPLMDFSGAEPMTWQMRR